MDQQYRPSEQPLNVAVMTPSETVTAFIQAIERLDIDGAVAILSDDVLYENVPMNPIAGREGVRAALAGFLGSASQVAWPVSSQFEHGNRVVNERVDRFKIGEGWLEMPVAGFFDVNDQGLITLWRDYFDLATYTDQMAALRP
jgi:limonene-1,2-epoxide hydrolase